MSFKIKKTGEREGSAGGCSLSYDTSVGYIVDAYYIDETTGEVVFGNAAGHFDRPHGDPCRVFL